MNEGRIYNTLVPKQVPTGTTDTTCTVTESQCCTTTRMHAPVYPGCEMQICALVRHGCVEWGLVTTQDRHKYNTCQPSVFPVQNEGWHVLYIMIISAITTRHCVEFIMLKKCRYLGYNEISYLPEGLFQNLPCLKFL